MNRSLIFFLSLILFTTIQASELNEKHNKIEQLRQQFSTQKLGRNDLNSGPDSLWELLSSEGRFSDFEKKEQEIAEGGYAQSDNMSDCIFINDLTRAAFERLWILSEDFRGNNDIDLSDVKLEKLLKAIVFYGKLENERNDQVSGRFHASCFSIPRSAVNIYFALFSLMEDVESKQQTNELAIEANKKLIDVAFQSWELPLRHDSTDNNIVSVDRFRKHVWWVGGNALDYRPVFETAIMMRSEPMVDVMADVSKRAISVVSQTTYDDAFWNEGMTADGAGWGHGRQCLVWGYPIDGMKGAFRILSYLKDSPWAETLSKENVDVLLNYVRKASFYHFKGVIPPVVDRYNMVRKEQYKSNIPSHYIARVLLNDWKNSLTDSEVVEMESYLKESAQFDVLMKEYPAGDYHGIHYFYNNDDIIKKREDYYLMVNMASSRVDGLESAYPGSSGYNFYTADGLTLFQKEGVGYRKIIGAMNLNAWPGITARQIESNLKPIENWRGFTSKHNFAAAAHNRKESFAGGFLFEKMNGSYRDNSEFAEKNDKNKDIYGVYAQKSYFMFDHVFLAIGTGITNLQADKEGDITTTIEQAYSPNSVSQFENEYEPIHIIEKYPKKTSKITWITNSGISYGILPKFTTGELRAGRELRKTNWQRLTDGNKGVEEEELPVFQMDINHGRDVTDGTYAYVVLMNDDISLRSKTPVVLQNNNRVHAAENYGGTQLGALFFEAGEKLKSSLGTFSVSHPSALFVERKGETLLISVTDALMDVNQNSIEIITNIPLSGENVEKIGRKQYKITIFLSREPHRGAPAVVELFTLK